MALGMERDILYMLHVSCLMFGSLMVLSCSVGTSLCHVACVVFVLQIIRVYLVYGNIEFSNELQQNMKILLLTSNCYKIKIFFFSFGINHQRPK